MGVRGHKPVPHSAGTRAQRASWEIGCLKAVRAAEDAWPGEVLVPHNCLDLIFSSIETTMLEKLSLLELARIN